MSLQNRQKSEDNIGYEVVYTDETENKSLRKTTIGYSKYVVIFIAIVSVVFFCIFFMNRQSAEEIKRQKMLDIANQYKAFNKGPQINSREFKGNRKIPSEDSNKESSHRLRGKSSSNGDQQSQGNSDDERGSTKDAQNKDKISGDESNDNEQKVKPKENTFKSLEDLKKSKSNTDKTENKILERQNDSKSNDSKTKKEKEEDLQHQREDSQDENEWDKKDTLQQKEELNKNGKQTEQNTKTNSEDSNKAQVEQGTTNDEQKEPSKPRFSFIDTRKENEIFFCSEDSYLFGNQCQEDCPEGFDADNYDRICKSSDMNPMQIELRQYPDPKDNSKEAKEIMAEYYQIIKSEEYALNGSAKYGFFFFNQFENGNFNYLNSKYGGQTLNKFLNNVDGIVVTFNGEDSYFLGNEVTIRGIIEQTIKSNPKIKQWYAIGLSDVGSYGALLYLNKLINQLHGAIVVNPNFMKMIDTFSTQIDFNQFPHSDIFIEVSQNLQALSEKNILIVSPRDSNQQQHSQNYAEMTHGQLITYDGQQFKKEELLEKVLFPNIEQFISHQNQNLLNKINK